MNRSRHSLARIGLGLVVLIALSTGVWFVADWLQDSRIERQADAYVQEMIDTGGFAGVSDFHQRIDQVRAFVNDHSEHKIDREFRKNQGDASAFASGVLAHAKGQGDQMHMECSTRSALMSRILKALGYQTRRVSIFDSDRDDKSRFVLKSSHTFLDVFNPATGRWETQDPDYDIYWRRKDDGQRISLVDGADLLDEIEPCGRTACGWQHVSREGIRAEKLAELLDIISVTDKERSVRFAVYTSRTNLDQTYTKGSKRGTFCEVEAKRCRDGFISVEDYEAYTP